MRGARNRFLFPAVTLLIACATGLSLRAQNESSEKDVEPPQPSTTEVSEATPQGKPLKLDISRRFLKNFLTDEVALIPYQDKDGATKELQGTFMIGAVKSSHAVFWDPVSCRMLGALNLKNTAEPAKSSEGDEEAPSPYTLLAAGSHPLSGSKGAFESPKYFGFRLVSGRPEFLYTFGGLQIEEQIGLEDEGLILKVRYVVKGSKSGFTLSFPAEWKARCEASVGEWKENQLAVPGDAAEALVLTFLLDKRESSQTVEN